jgi:hypothetical protein
LVLHSRERRRLTRDRLAWFVYEGKTILSTKRSHGNKEQPGHLIRQQLKLNEQQLAGLISCSVSKADYIQILVKKNLIVVPEKPKPSHSSKSTQ